MYAIPSPARRETRGWVLEAVPLVPASPVETGSNPVRVVKATG